MRRMIEDLLQFSRVGRAELRVAEVDLGDLVHRVADRARADSTHEGAVVEVGSLPTVRADAGQLERVVQNLLGNAVKFRRPGMPARVDVTASRLEAGWRIEVADQGIGVEEQYRERIFRMFQRLHPADRYPGTGIGLAIAERIIDRHGGNMGVGANPSGGATFWFTIPDELPEEPWSPD
jgi:two-component system, chemotaxis family, sensor kinase Cph1